METRTWTENGTPVTKEKTVAFSGHRTNRIAKFTADREKLFREVAFDTFVAIESYCIKKATTPFCRVVYAKLCITCLMYTKMLCKDKVVYNLIHT